MKKTLPTVTTSLLLALSVLLNGVHAKDVLNLTVQSDGAQAAKVVADLHPHVDKQVHKMTSDTALLDGRSLRLRDYKRMQFNGLRNLLGLWRDQLALYLG